MSDVPTFVDLQGFVVGRRRKFVVKEAAILRNGSVLAHYVFGSPEPWHRLGDEDKCRASWVTTHHHRLRWNDGNVPYNLAKCLITNAVMGDATRQRGDFSPIVYVKGHEKQSWLRDLLWNDARDHIIADIDVHYEDIESLNKLDIIGTFRCTRHTQNCALQNVFKLFNWWVNHE